MRKLSTPTTARLVKLQNSDWYILWRNGSTRYRFKSGLNRIKDLTLREAWAQKIVAFINEAALVDNTPTENDVKAYFDALKSVKTPPSVKAVTLTAFDSFFTDFIAQNTPLLAEMTTISRTTIRNNLRLFAKEVYKKEALEWSDFDSQLPKKLTIWGYAQPREWSQNTLSKTFLVLRRVLNEAAEQGLPTSPAWKTKHYIVKAAETDAIALNLSELNHIAHFNLSDAPPRLARVRDVFVLACLTGLRYSDVSKLSAANLKTLVRADGTTVEVIEVVQQKTAQHDGRVVVPLHDTAKRIIEAHGGKPPAAYSNQKMNNYIKELGELVGLTDAIQMRKSKAGRIVVRSMRRCDAMSTHTARRTFATIAFVQWRIPSPLIMQITGHKSERDFLRYIRIEKEAAALNMVDYFR